MRKLSSMEQSLRLDIIKALDILRDNANFSIFEGNNAKSKESLELYLRVWNPMNFMLYMVRYKTINLVSEKVNKYKLMT